MVLAGITLFNPELERLEENIAAILNQVDRVICVDNGSKNIQEVEAFLKRRFPEVLVQKNEENVGIAKVLNQIFSYGKEKGFAWVLTLDQDSVCPANLMEEYHKYMNMERVGVLSPHIIDRNFQKNQEMDTEFDEIDKCITSASLTRMETWEKVGGFWEYLFIDYVDHDFCAKCMEVGIKMLRINKVTILHELGKGIHKRLLGRQLTVLNHSPMRKYYIVRNRLIYMKVHRDVIDLKEERKKYIYFYVKTLLFEDQKWEKLKAMVFLDYNVDSRKLEHKL
jgi:rhamnosyltransferase